MGDKTPDIPKNPTNYQIDPAVPYQSMPVESLQLATAMCEELAKSLQAQFGSSYHIKPTIHNNIMGAITTGLYHNDYYVLCLIFYADRLVICGATRNLVKLEKYYNDPETTITNIREIITDHFERLGLPCNTTHD